MSITPEQARAELARRELAKRQQQFNPENENLLQKITRYGIKDPAIGFLNMGREFANLPNKVSGGRIPEFSPSDFNFGKTLGVENPEGIDNLIQFAGQYAPAFALPGANIGKLGKLLSKIPKAGKFASEAVSQAIPQALYSAAQAPQDSLQAGAQAGGMMIPFSGLNQLMQSTNPKVKTMAKLLGFGGAGFLGREAAKSMGMGEFGADAAALFAGALGARGMDSVKDRNLRLSEGMNIPLANKKLKAAKRLGLDYLTPAEAGESQIAAGRQGALGKTEEGAQLLQNKAKSRVDSEAQAIERTLNQIYLPEKMDEQVKNAYSSINEVNLPQEFPLQYKDNEIVKEAKRMVEATPAYKESLKELMPKNAKLQQGQIDPQATSLVYWDHVKRAMDDMVSKAERAGNKNEARIISNTRANMRDQMDAAYPEYKEARALYERKMVREGLEKVFDRKEVNGSNFYQALASQRKFDEVIGHLKNAPDAVQNLKDMRLVFKELLGPRTIKTAKGKEEYGMNQSRSSGAFLENMIEHIFTKGGSDKAAIEFITSPDWTKQLKEIKKISNKQMKMAALALTLSKGVSQYAEKQERKPMELELIGGNR